MAKDSNERAAARLKRLREDSGLSVRELAALIERPSSTYSSYEDKYKKEYLPLDLVQQIAPHLIQRGADPDAVFSLAGVAAPQGGIPGARGNTVTIGEVDVLAGAGLGGEASQVVVVRSGGLTISADAEKASWSLPSAYAQGELGIDPRFASIVEVRGDSMAPTLTPGDRVLVDTRDRIPSPPGLFVLWDGFGLMVKRVEIAERDDPIVLRLISDNPLHRAEERTVEEVHIVGRVRWRATRM